MEYARIKLKLVKRVGTTRFHVEVKEDDMIISPSSPTFDADDTDQFWHVPLLLFSQSRQIFIDEKGIMFCTCPIFECRGYFCADQVCVADMVYQASGKILPGFTHHDVACRYCTAYTYMV